MTASLSTDPRRAREALRLARQVVERFATTGPTPEELAAARRQVESRRTADAASPSAWADRLSGLELRGEDTSALGQQADALDAVTADEVRAAFAHYVGAGRPLALVAMPAWNLALGTRSIGAPMR
jgi:predicted Zn-dependent peptidase